jgi:hypothetical protein
MSGFLASAVRAYPAGANHRQIEWLTFHVDQPTIIVLKNAARACHRYSQRFGQTTQAPPGYKVKRDQSRPQKHHQDNVQEEKGKDRAAIAAQAGQRKREL